MKAELGDTEDNMNEWSAENGGVVSSNLMVLTQEKKM